MRTFMEKTAVSLLAIFVLFFARDSWALTANDVNKQMREAQNLYFKGKFQEADTAMKKAEEMVSDIITGSDIAEKEKIERMNGRLKKLRKDINGKLGKNEDAAGATGSTASAQPTTKTAGGDTLPSHVTSELRVVERYIDSAQQNLNANDIRNARRSLESAQNKLEQTADHKKRYITPEHPEYKSLQTRIESVDTVIRAAEGKQVQQKAAAEEAAANARAESEQWIARLKPYVTGKGTTGYDPDRYFIAGYTEDQQEMAKQTDLFSKVSADMDAYRAAGLGDDATDSLKEIVRQVEYKLKTFDDSTRSMAELKVGNAEKQIDYILSWHNKEAEKIGTQQMPNSMSRMTFESARRDLDSAANLLGEDEARVKALEAKYKNALSLAAKLAKARVAQTRMIQDKFDGSEMTAIKKRAEDVLETAKSGVKILRTTVVSPDWQEESVIEWTDTSRSSLRHRVTRSVSAQVAGKVGGETTLYTIHIAKDRRTDGSWSQLRGHIMFEDAILEENVEK